LTYLLDANVFITAKNVHYGLDFVPAFWDWLEHAAHLDIACSIEPVYRELQAGGDDLSIWAAEHRSVFRDIDSSVVPSFVELSRWVSLSNYTAAAQTTFLGNADYQIVAFAHAHGLTVVTHEKPEPSSYKRVKIPDACIALNVPCINPFTMLRRESASFVLSR
jgi:predicted nucleic acid-binding protein